MVSDKRKLDGKLHLRIGRSVMIQWLRFERDGEFGFGTLNDGAIAV